MTNNTFPPFNSGFDVGDFVRIDALTGIDETVSGRVTKVQGAYIWIDDNPKPYHIAGAIKLFNVITIESKSTNAARSQLVYTPDNDNFLINSLLEGDGKRLREIAMEYERLMDENYAMDNDLQLSKKMLEKITAERDELKEMLARLQQRVDDLEKELHVFRTGVSDQ